MDLHFLLPRIVRWLDERASAGADETFWQRFLYGMEQEAGSIQADITGLADLADPQAVSTAYLPLLARLLGSSPLVVDSVERRRALVEALSALYRKSGQRPGWKALLNFMGQAKAYPKELFKQEIYEDFDYYESDDDYYAPYHAARVRVKDSLENTISLTAAERRCLDSIRPIHVLIDIPGELTAEFSDAGQEMDAEAFSGAAAMTIAETLEAPTDACGVSCETSCQASCEGGSCEGSFEVVMTCVLTCETAAES